MGARRSSGRGLLAAVRSDTTSDELAQAFHSVDEVRIVELAVKHRVAGMLHARLEPLSLLSPAALNELALHRRRAAAHHLLALRLADRLSEIMPCEWVLFKGPFLAQMYGELDHRTYTDLDILVRRRDFRSSFEALTRAGLVSRNRNWQGFLDLGVAELPLDSEHMVLDLHWHPIALRSQRRTVRLDPEAMMDRSVPAALGKREFHAFEPVDTLLHLCAHSGLSGGARLIWLLDIDAVVRSNEIDWDIFVARAKTSGMSTMAAMLLERAQRFLNTPIADGVENALEPSKLMLAAHRAMRTVPRSDGHIGAGVEFGLLQSAARDGTTNTAMALGASIRTRVSERLRRDSGPAADLDWRRDRGGPTAEAAWFNYVESEHL